LPGSSEPYLPGFALGPVAGVVVSVLKELIYALSFPQTGGGGELAENGARRVRSHKEARGEAGQNSLSCLVLYCVTHYDTFKESVRGEGDKLEVTISVL